MAPKFAITEPRAIVKARGLVRWADNRFWRDCALGLKPSRGWPVSSNADLKKIKLHRGLVFCQISTQSGKRWIASKPVFGHAASAHMRAQTQFATMELESIKREAFAQRLRAAT